MQRCSIAIAIAISSVVLVMIASQAGAINPGPIVKAGEVAADAEKASHLLSAYPFPVAESTKLYPPPKGFGAHWERTASEKVPVEKLVPKELEGFLVNPPEAGRVVDFRQGNESRENFREFVELARKGEARLGMAEITNVSISPQGEVTATIDIYSQLQKSEKRGPTVYKTAFFPVGAKSQVEVKFKNLTEYNRYVGKSIYRMDQRLDKWLKLDIAKRNYSEWRAMMKKTFGARADLMSTPEVMIDPLGRVHYKYYVSYKPNGRLKDYPAEDKIFASVAEYNNRMAPNGKPLPEDSPFRINPSELAPHSIEQQAKLFEEQAKKLDGATENH
jgi:hypothetical protein